MSDDLEYFTEFLENPAAPDLNEFFRMLRRWAIYIEEHKHEFVYLEDDEWKDVRERIIDELDVRVDQKDDLEDEWEDLREAIGNHDRIDRQAWMKLLERRLDFMKTYNFVFDIPDEDIVKFEKVIEDLAMDYQEARNAEQAVRFSKIALDDAIADLDEQLADEYERTGKTPVLPMSEVYKEKKVYKGN